MGMPSTSTLRQPHGSGAGAMTHGEFVQAYRAGEIRVNIDRRDAARFVSARLWLPLFMLPVLGIGIALALVGWLWAGFGLIALGTIAPMLIKRSAPHFVLTQALEDERFYGAAMDAGLLDVQRTP
jgi:hypothetical protein